MANAYHSKEKYAQIAAKIRGQKRTLTTRRNISKSLMGHKFSPETIEKFKQRRHSPETKEKLRQLKLGKTPWNKGVPMSDEQKAILRKVNLGRKTPPDVRIKLRDSMLRHFKSQSPKYIAPTYEEGETHRKHEEIRRKRLQSNGGSHTENQWEYLKAAHEYKCQICKKQEPKIKLTKDHIISIRNGGNDDISNIQPLCRSCNSKKH